MAPAFAGWAAGGFFPAFVAVFLFTATAGFLALCALCKRKENNRIPVLHEELLEAVLLRHAELSSARESAPDLPKLKRANSRGKNQSPARVSVPYEDDGTASSCSFIILPQRELPQPPLSPEETYSNLTFPKRDPEMFFESVTVEDEEPCVIPKETTVKFEQDQTTGAAYAHVLKGKQKNSQAMLEVEEMYSVVCKDKKKKKKKKKSRNCEEGSPQVKVNPSNCHGVNTEGQETDARTEPHSSSFNSFMIEPCYESVHCESSATSAQTEAPEPTYETVDIHWKNPKRKGKSKRKAPVENLYESIENLAFHCQSVNMASHC